MASYIANADILYKLWVDAGLVNDLLHKSVEKIVKLGVFEAALESFTERRPDGKSNDNVVGIFGSTVDGLLAYALGECGGGAVYIEDKPELPGVRCLRREVSLSVIIIDYE